LSPFNSISRINLQGETMPLKRVNVLIVVAALLSAPSLAKPAESAPIDLSASIRKITFPTADRRLLARSQRPRQAAPCDPLRHALIGAVVGFGAGMVVIQRIVREEDGRAGAKSTFLAGVYGATIGGAVGLGTCR
jgi:hypothetical protein